mmetsp:Transcript_62518/g.152202  ORF Transcript_62518/g.152202 Transcript_62518/m.152202 type:complete len:107 (-) Transcript_62518:2264-2584(-)
MVTVLLSNDFSGLSQKELQAKLIEKQSQRTTTTATSSNQTTSPTTAPHSAESGDHRMILDRYESRFASQDARIEKLKEEIEELKEKMNKLLTGKHGGNEWTNETDE